MNTDEKYGKLGNDAQSGKHGNADNRISPGSHISHSQPQTPANQPIIPPRGDYQTLLSFQKAEVIANIAICLLHQTNYLLDQQLRRLETDFLEQGGLRERMFQARLAHRNQQHKKRCP